MNSKIKELISLLGRQIQNLKEPAYYVYFGVIYLLLCFAHIIMLCAMVCYDPISKEETTFFVKRTDR